MSTLITCISGPAKCQEQDVPFSANSTEVAQNSSAGNPRNLAKEQLAQAFLSFVKTAAEPVSQSQSANLRNHIRAPIGDLPFVCKVCNRAAAWCWHSHGRHKRRAGRFACRCKSEDGVCFKVRQERVRNLKRPFGTTGIRCM